MVDSEVFLATMSSFFVVGVGAFLWILSEFRAVREENRRTREELRQEIRENTQRILEPLYFHRHDQDGSAVFYPPTPTAPTPATPVPPAD